ncbi:MAG: type II secretion system F family protein [Planctomycetes bacterium]|nr:type II secretion system F family protein [Planctomycetota bacterium]
MTITVLLLAWIVGIGGLYLAGRHWLIRHRSLERMFEDADADALEDLAPAEDSYGFLRRWLFRAGFRTPSAVTIYVFATILCAGLGLLIALTVILAGWMQLARSAVGQVPGGLSDILIPLVYLAPWAVLLLLASVPTMVVRAARRNRVTEVEQDLPITLELLATLSEAGLGFDAALERVLQSQDATRVLVQEFRILQMEILAGRPRIQCLRRLSWRLDVMSLSIFVSALVQTEQVGAGVSDVLRRQADDLRGRRREEALTKAASLPVKLLFPLVICFLPGILTATLGPTFYQIFQFLDNIARTRGLP